MCAKDSGSKPAEILSRLQLVTNDLQMLKSLISNIIIAGHHEFSTQSGDVSMMFRQVRSHISGAHEETSLALEMLEELKRYSL